MKKLLLCLTLVSLASGCGSTGTEASGSDDDTTTVGVSCASFAFGPGLICVPGSPPTINIDFGTEAGKVAEGSNIPNPNRGKYLGSFTPSTVQGNPVTMAAPGGQFGTVSPTTGLSRTGQAIYNAASGRVGIRAADEICSAITNWPGKTAAVTSAHACTNAELIANVNKGLINPPLSGMTYDSQSYVSYQDAGMDTTRNSWKASCANWTYTSGDIAQGTRFDVVQQTFRNDVADPNNAITIKFTSGQPCATALPIACCE